MSWDKKPIKNSFGLRTILLKSFIERPRPNENIINAKAIGRITSVTIFIKLNYHLILKINIKLSNIYNRKCYKN